MSEVSPSPSQEGLFTEELSSEKSATLGVSELHPPLANAAKRASKAVKNARRGNDMISAEKEHSTTVIVALAAPAVLGMCQSLLAGITGNYGAALSAMAYTGYIGYNEIYRCHIQPESNDRIQLPYTGYGLQCFKVQADEAGCNTGEVAMMIIPRKHAKGEYEGAAIACKRLTDVATVAKFAQPDKMIVPSAILRAANAPIVGNRPLKASLGRMVEAETTADSTATALIIETSNFIKMVESLNINGDTVQAEVMKALHRRYPHIEAFATPNDAAFETLGRCIRALTERAASGELPGAIRAREQDEEQVRTVRKSLPTPEIRISDGDVLVTQRDDKHQVLEAFSLATMGEALKGDEAFLHKLSIGREGHSDLELIAIAAHTLLQRKQQQGNIAVSEHKETSPIPLGTAGEFIAPLHSNHAKTYETIRRINKVLCLSAVAIGASMVLNPFLASTRTPSTVTALPAPVIPTHEAAQNEMSWLGYAPTQAGGKENPEWKVAPFNMDGGGYYAADFNYSLDLHKGGWTNEMPKNTAVSLPTGLDNPHEPRITLSRPLDGSTVYDLPYRGDTRIAAARVRSAKGEIMPITLAKSADGMMSFVPGEQRLGDWLEYDLVETATLEARAMQPITTNDRLSNPPRELAKLVDHDSPAHIASAFQERYWYNNSPTLGTISQQRSAEGYIKALEKSKECNCNICATGAALVQHAKHPHVHMAYTTGFLNNDGGDTLLYSRHAWLTDSWGAIAEATPYRNKTISVKNEQSREVITADQKKAALEQEWQQKAQALTAPPAPAPKPEAPEEPSIPWGWVLGAFGMAAAAGVVGAELQSGAGSRAIRSLRRKVVDVAVAESMSDAQAYNLMNWHMHGKPASHEQPGSKPPLLADSTGKRNPSLIPSDVLEAIARESLPLPDEYFTSQGVDPKDGHASLRRKAQALLENRK